MKNFLNWLCMDDCYAQTFFERGLTRIERAVTLGVYLIASETDRKN